jgi:hypothetical protein
MVLAAVRVECAYSRRVEMALMFGYAEPCKSKRGTVRETMNISGTHGI